MRLTLHDFQHGSDDPFDGALIHESDTLLDIFEQLQRRAPFILELEGENGYRLTVGIGGPVGCIQHSSKSGEPPYLIAVAKNSKRSADEEEYVFLCGGQDTAVRGNRCVPFATLQRVACHFLETGLRSTEVDWVEV
jgi:hypothetical protein